MIVTIFSVPGIFTVFPFIWMVRKVPNPERTTFSPLAKTLPISFKKTSTDSLAPRLVRCAFRATKIINCLFVISGMKNSVLKRKCQEYGTFCLSRISKACFSLLLEITDTVTRGRSPRERKGLCGIKHSGFFLFRCRSTVSPYFADCGHFNLTSIFCFFF